MLSISFSKFWNIPFVHTLGCYVLSAVVIFSFYAFFMIVPVIVVCCVILRTFNFTFPFILSFEFLTKNYFVTVTQLIYKSPE